MDLELPGLRAGAIEDGLLLLGERLASVQPPQDVGELFVLQLGFVFGRERDRHAGGGASMQGWKRATQDVSRTEWTSLHPVACAENYGRCAILISSRNSGSKEPSMRRNLLALS